MRAKGLRLSQMQRQHKENLRTSATRINGVTATCRQNGRMRSLCSNARPHATPTASRPCSTRPTLCSSPPPSPRLQPHITCRDSAGVHSHLPCDDMGSRHRARDLACPPPPPSCSRSRGGGGAKQSMQQSMRVLDTQVRVTAHQHAPSMYPHTSLLTQVRVDLRRRPSNHPRAPRPEPRKDGALARPGNAGGAECATSHSKPCRAPASIQAGGRGRG